MFLFVHYSEPSLRWIVGVVLTICFAVVLSTSAQAQSVMPRVKGKCPAGTFRSGGYCESFPSVTRDGISFIVRNGSHCPVGYFTSGKHYCRQLTTTDETVIPRKNGESCPVGWYRSVDYCRSTTY